MSASVLKGYVRGTHRTISPEATLAAIEPRLAMFNITRCADVTGLDRIGIPVCCSIRPVTKTLQVSNGKGLRLVDAKVSCLMEAIELFHAENPPDAGCRRSLAHLRAGGEEGVQPQQLPGFDPECHFDDDWIIDWTRGENLLTNEPVWLPASSVYLCRRSIFHWDSNGLASGNHLVEATLHALYEVLERHAISKLVDSAGKIRFERTHIVDVASVTDNSVADLRARIEGAGLKLVLISPRNDLAIHTFMAVILDPTPFGNASMVNVGYGSHLSVSLAATRAITEAAQSRLTFIHGSREDLPQRAYVGGETHRLLFNFFERLPANTRWDQFKDLATDTLSEDFASVLAIFEDGEFGNAYRADLTSHDGIHVVKVLVEGALVRSTLF